jgi:hypothetical protein
MTTLTTTPLSHHQHRHFINVDKTTSVSSITIPLTSVRGQSSQAGNSQRIPKTHEVPTHPFLRTEHASDKSYRWKDYAHRQTHIQQYLVLPKRQSRFCLLVTLRAIGCSYPSSSLRMLKFSNHNFTWQAYKNLHAVNQLCRRNASHWTRLHVLRARAECCYATIYACTEAPAIDGSRFWHRLLISIVVVLLYM